MGWLDAHWILLTEGTDQWRCHEHGNDTWGFHNMRRVTDKLLASRLVVCPDDCVVDDDNGNSRIKRGKLSGIR